MMNLKIERFIYTILFILVVSFIGITIIAGFIMLVCQTGSVALVVMVYSLIFSLFLTDLKVNDLEKKIKKLENKH